MAIIDQMVGEGVKGSDVWDQQFHTELRENASNYFDPAVSGKLRELSAVANPPSSNTGGTSPLPPPKISHGGKEGEIVVTNKTKIDWLAFTTVAELSAVEAVLQVIWPDVVLKRREKGMHGYPESYGITVDAVPYGVFCCGASHGRNYVSLDGTACKTLTDELVEVFHEALSIPSLEVLLSRVDLALDFYRGELTWDHAYRAYNLGHFKRPRANKSPEMQEIKTVKDGRNLGRTMYVGKRDGHVFVRVYEKGLEVFASLPEDLRLASEVREMDKEAAVPEDERSTFQADSWVRLEVEYKKDGKDLLLPLEMMLKRDHYFAGANPYFEKALDRSDLAGVRPGYLKTDVQVDLAVMLKNAKRSYGSLVQSLTDLGLTPYEIVQELTNGKQNARLVKAGVMASAAEAVKMIRNREQDWDIPF